MWNFLIVAVVFGTLSSILNNLIRRKHSQQDHALVEGLQDKISQLESKLAALPALPAHEQQRVGDIEGRVQALETIITKADEALEQRFHDAAKQFSQK